MNYCKIEYVKDSRPAIEGAGVRLRRAIGNGDPYEFDPFLLFDDFRSTNPLDFMPGFPWHPHRGIETVTYMLEGSVEHGDSLGNLGVIGAGDIQWMTAGSGIIHQEMPKPAKDNKMGGLQLWINLPQQKKMITPRYYEVKNNDIPLITEANGAKVKVIAGNYKGTKGAAKDLFVDCSYFDIWVPAYEQIEFHVGKNYTVFAYVLEGDGYLSPVDDKHSKANQLVKLIPNETFLAQAEENPLHFIFVSGMPLKEPIAWRGPIVMNTQEELIQAYDDLDNNTFIKK